MLARRPFARAAAATAALAGLAHPSCGGSSTPAPSSPTVTLRPAPTPSSAPIDAFSDAGCTLGAGDLEARCVRTGASRLLSDYEQAIDLLIQQSPSLFDLKDEAAPGTKAYRVLDKDGFMNGLVKNLRAAHLCAERDPDDALQETIKLKNTNDYSEDYDVLLASGHVRRGEGAYRQTCEPAYFPLDRKGDVPPIGSGCGRPYPPVVTRFNCKVHIRSVTVYTLDSTPIVGPDGNYCAAIGYSDGRTLCPIRPEGAPDREACENWRVGKAKDTGRPGPTWTKGDGSYCTGPESGCENHPNPYSLFTYVSGTYVVTAENGASCSVSY